VGWVAEFLNKPIVTGFVFGLTILVIIGELPNLLGIPVTPGDVLHRISVLLRNISQIDLLTAAVGVSALAVLFIGQRLLPRMPCALVVLVLGLTASHWFELAAHGVAVVGQVPKGLPRPSVPLVPLSQLVDIVFAGAAIAFVGLAEGLSAGRLYAAKGHYRLNTDQELIAAGGANIGSGGRSRGGDGRGRRVVNAGRCGGERSTAAYGERLLRPPKGQINRESRSRGVTRILTRTCRLRMPQWQCRRYHTFPHGLLLVGVRTDR
jgi:Sulfate permease family